MFGKTSKICLLISISALGVSACSGGYDDYYDSGYYDYGSYYQGGAYGMNANAGCVPVTSLDAQGNTIVSYNPMGLRGGDYYGYEQRSRYGSTESVSMMSQCQSGYWIIPTYQIAETSTVSTAVPETITPSVTSTSSVIVQESCPDGQYRMDNGVCAIMLNEETEVTVTEQYVPPIQSVSSLSSYPETTTSTSVQWYEPIRK